MDFISTQPYVFISWAGATTFVFVLLYKAGILHALGRKLNGGNGLDIEKRLKAVENDQYHYLLNEITEIKTELNGFKKEMREKMDGMNGRLIALETRYSMK